MVSMLAWPKSTSFHRLEQGPTWNLRTPAGEHLAAQHTSPSLRTRIKDTAARGCANRDQDDSGSEEEQAARGRVWSGRGALAYWIAEAPVQSRLHIMEVTQSLRRARQQPTRAEQLCWTLIRLIHRRCTTALSLRGGGRNCLAASLDCYLWNHDWGKDASMGRAVQVEPGGIWRLAADGPRIKNNSWKLACALTLNGNGNSPQQP
jgi:hypothetical protein